MRRLLAPWLLGVALVVAQHGAYDHALSHLDEALHRQDERGPADHPREVCVAFATATGGPVASCALAVGADPTPIVRVSTAPVDPLLPPLPLTRYASRAPPFAS